MEELFLEMALEAAASLGEEAAGAAAGELAAGAAGGELAAGAAEAGGGLLGNTGPNLAQGGISPGKAAMSIPNQFLPTSDFRGLGAVGDLQNSGNTPAMPQPPAPSWGSQLQQAGTGFVKNSLGSDFQDFGQISSMIDGFKNGGAGNNPYANALSYSSKPDEAQAQLEKLKMNISGGNLGFSARPMMSTTVNPYAGPSNLAAQAMGRYYG